MHSTFSPSKNACKIYFHILKTRNKSVHSSGPGSELTKPNMITKAGWNFGPEVKLDSDWKYITVYVGKRWRLRNNN
jgi:hypothetical protein